MLASRFWYVVLGLLVGTATFLLFLATSMYNRAGARAMGEARWKQLTADQQTLLERGIAVWEHALAAEIDAAEHAGERTGRERGVEFFDMPEADQQRFDAIYERDAERRAHALARYGLDGIASFRRARAIASGLRSTGEIQCEKGNDRKTT